MSDLFLRLVNATLFFYVVRSLDDIMMCRCMQWIPTDYLMCVLYITSLALLPEH